MGKIKLDAETMANALTYQAQPSLTVYLHPARIDHAFGNVIGNPKDVQRTYSHLSSGKAGANVVVASAESGIQIGAGGSVTFNTEDPLIRAHLLRAELGRRHQLGSPLTAKKMSPVLASGPGQILTPDKGETDALRRWEKPLTKWLPPNALKQFLDEHEERATFARPDDPTPVYSPAVAKTPTGPVVALLGDHEVLWPLWVSHRKTEAICTIIGLKAEQFDDWVFVDPWQVSLELRG
jgi:hypothetical protein